MSIKRSLLALSAAASLFAVNAPVLAMPGNNPETMSCHQLWVARNAIYKDNGYCFKTKKARKFFGNAGCWIDSQWDVPLTKSERKEVHLYKHWENVNGC